jgi:hypothetical protein
MVKSNWELSGYMRVWYRGSPYGPKSFLENGKLNRFIVEFTAETFDKHENNPLKVKK